ncbi:MAG: hypothetical protein DMF70_00765, partial [Acidobacteria bacterium]
MTVYIGVDFHARAQTIGYLTTEDGEIQRLQRDHGQPKEVRSFHQQFSESREVLQQLRYRQRLVKMGTMVVNSLL